MVIAHKDYQPIEYIIPKEILKTAGFKITVASDLSGMATSSSGQSEKIDLVLKDVVVSDFDGVVFIGGSGAWDFLNNEISYRIIRGAAEENMVLGAICISPRILASAGVLKGKKVTGWNGDEELANVLNKAGAIYMDQSVVVDGNLVTASGPSAAEEFGKKLVDILSVS